MAGHPTDVIFLTCDAFGVLPPVSRLTPAQAMYHFISGYTAKVAGTEVGVTEPQATFSPCFGGPFLVWHPTKYAELLARRSKQHCSQRLAGQHRLERRAVWHRVANEAGHSPAPSSTPSTPDELASAPRRPDPIFGFDVLTACPEVPKEILIPRNTWQDKSAYDETARKLVNLFNQNFHQYETGAGQRLKEAAPRA